MATGVTHFFDETRFMSSVGGIVGATVYFYYTGTSNPAPIYSDIALSVPMTNPVVIAQGAIPPNIFLDPTVTYRRRIVFSDTSVQDVDPIAPSGYTKTADLASLLANKGSGLVGFSPSVAYPVSTVGSKLQDMVSVKDFGAVGNGSTDDTNAFQNAINTGKQVFVPYSALGYVVGGLIASTSGGLIGEDERTKIILKAATTNWLTLRTSNFSVGNLLFTSGANCTGSLIYLDTNAGSYEKHRIFNIVTDQLAAPFFKDANAAGSYDELYIWNITLQRHANQAVVMRDGFAYLFITELTVDLASSTSPNWTFIDVQNSQGLTLERVEIEGSAFVGATNAAQIGIDIRTCSAIWLRRCFVDTTGGKGIYISGCAYVHIMDTVVSLCDGNAVEISATTIIQSDKLLIIGRNQLASKTATIHGLLLTNGCGSANFTNTFSGYNTGDGIKVDHTTTNNQIIHVSSAMVISNTGVGLRTVGTTGTPSGFFCDFIFNTNGGGDYMIANMGAGSGFERIYNAQLGSGAGVFDGNIIFNNTAGSTGIGRSPTQKLDVGGNLQIAPASSVTPTNNGDIVFQATSNTSFTIKMRGSDGVVRSGSITLV